MSGGDDTYGGACTDYSPYDVPKLVQILTENHEAAWRQSQAFMDTFTTLLSYASILDQVRDRIAQAWPPESSPAARSYLAVLDDLLGSIRATGEAAMDNGNAVAQVLLTLSENKSRIDNLHAEWQHNVREDNAPLAFITSNAPKNWRQDLNHQAWSQMVAADADYFSAKIKMTVPESFSLGFGEKLTPVDTKPPIRTQSVRGGSGGTTGPGGSGGSAVGFWSPGASEQGEFGDPSTPVLAGSGPMPVATGVLPTAREIPSSLPIGTAGGAFGGGALVGGVIGFSTALSGVDSVGYPGAMATARGVSGVFAGNGGSSGAAGRPNPVGGMLGGPVRHSDESGDESVARDEWALAEGVEPVILPTVEVANHDPGIGVIGVHR